MYKISNFILNRILGLFFIAISFFSFFSIISSSDSDPPYTTSNLSEGVNNSLGILGAYFSGYVIEFFGVISYLIPVFFIFIGFKITFNIKINFVLIRLLSFIISLQLISWILYDIFQIKSIVGNIFSQLLITNFEFILINKIYYLLLVILVTIIAIILLTFSLSIKFINLKKSLVPINSVFKIIIKILGLFKIFKSLFKINFKRNHNSFSNSQNENKFSKVKKEPTFDNVQPMQDYKTDSFIKKEINKYNIPPASLLLTSQEKDNISKEIEKRNQNNMLKLENILKDFGITGEINNYKTGPIVTLFEFYPSAGIKSSKIIGLANDLARSMSSMSARISSQPGKNSIGIEIPNEKKRDVFLGDLINDQNFKNSNQGLVLALGKNISGEKIYTDLERMPHLLIAGTTGSGKSVGINSMIMSLLFKFKPSECKLILIDPKMLELSVYENIPHLLTPVVTDPKKAVFALKWVVREMENRYRLMSSAGVKNIKSFNSKILDYKLSGKKLFREAQTGIDQETNLPIIEKKEIPPEVMPVIVVVIDEMADLMMVAGKEVENLIQRLSQMARASGIHLIAATQRPSVDVITGTIKANFPSRISYRVASKFDSRTILNEMGAEQLLGSGDMLFLENGANLIRLHGGFVSEKEIEKVVNFINLQPTNEIQKDITEEVKSDDNDFVFNDSSGDIDVLYQKAISIVMQYQKASTSFLQRHLQIGYNRAARIIEQMERDKVISEANHVGKRSVLKKNN